MYGNLGQRVAATAHPPEDQTAQPTGRSFDDFLKDEQTRAAAERAMLDAPDNQPPLSAMSPHEAPVVDTPRDMPPEVFKELVRRFGAAKRGSPERNMGIEEMDQGGKHYKYDAYAGQEARGYPRDRTTDGVGNFFQRLATNFGPNPEGEKQRFMQQRQSVAASRLKEREMGADETYRQAMLESQERTRQDSRRRGLVEIEGRAYDRAASRFASTQPRPRDASQEGLANAQAELAHAEAEAIRKGRTKNGGIPGGQPKPDFTPDQAFTNMRQSQQDIDEIDQEIGQIDNFKPADHSLIPDSIERMGGWGKFSDGAQDVPIFKKGDTKYPTKVIPAAEVKAYRQQLVDARAEAAAQHTKFREIVRNGNHVPDAEKGDDPYEDQFNDDDVPPGTPAVSEMTDEERGDDPSDPGGWKAAKGVAPAGSIDPDQAGKLAAAPPSQSGVPTADKGHRPKPSKEQLARLPYFDQVYYQLADAYGNASDRELKRMAAAVIAAQGKPRGGMQARPAPGHGR